MNADQDLSLARHFAELPDPRLDRTKKHHLSDILIITLCATIAGADSWEEVQRFVVTEIDGDDEVRVCTGCGERRIVI